VGLAAATSLSAFLNALLLLVSLRRGAIYQPSAQWLRFSLVLLLSVTVMLVVLFWMLSQVGSDQVWQYGTWWQRVLRIALLCGAGLFAYLGCLLASGFRLADLRGPSKATSTLN
jgi:putative peptidoglycan lipid II flippase